MDKFLESYNLSGLNQEKKNLNRSITGKELETVIKNLPQNMCPGPDGLTSEFYQTLRWFNTYPSETLPKKKKKIKGVGILSSSFTRLILP